MSPPPFPRDHLQRLVEQWREGEDPEGAFRRLVEACYRPVHRFFEKRGFREEAKDLTQETFVRIYTGLDGYRDEARFETWLFSVATNVFLRHRRDRRALKRGAGQAPLPLEDRPREPAVPGEGPLETAIGRQEKERLRRAVEELPSKMRTVLKLSLYQNRSRQEIAVALGVSPETVKAHLRQARQRLAKALGPDGGSPGEGSRGGRS